MTNTTIIQNKTRRLIESEPTEKLLKSILVPIPEIKKDPKAIEIAQKIKQSKNK